MLKYDGVNRSHPYQFQILSKLKFVFLFICIFILVIIGINHKNHIYAGLGLDFDESSDEYKHQKQIFLASIILLGIFFLLDFSIILSGLTYNANKTNVCIIMVKFFDTLLMFFYWIDDWQSLSLLYICIFEFITLVTEIYTLIYSFCCEFNKYDRIRLKKVKFIEKVKAD